MDKITDYGNFQTRKLFLFFTIFTAFVIQSCNKNDQENVQPLDPEVELIFCETCVFSDTTLVVNSTFSININAYQGGSVLDDIKIKRGEEPIFEKKCEYENEMYITESIDELKVPSEEGEYTYEVIITDKNNRTGSVSFTIHAQIKAPNSMLAPILFFETCEGCVGEGDTIFTDQSFMFSFSAKPAESSLAKITASLGEHFIFDIPISENEMKTGVEQKEMLKLLSEVEPGSYTFTLQVHDNSGNESLVKMDLEVVSFLNPPTVEIGDCFNCKTIYVGVPFTLYVNGEKGDGEIESVLVYINDHKVAEFDTDDIAFFDQFYSLTQNQITLQNSIEDANSYALTVTTTDYNGKSASTYFFIDQVMEPKLPKVSFGGCPNCFYEGDKIYKGLDFYTKITANAGSVELKKLSLSIGNFTKEYDATFLGEWGFNTEIETKLESDIDEGTYTVYVALEDINGFIATNSIPNVEVKIPKMSIRQNILLSYDPFNFNLPSFYNVHDNKLYIEQMNASQNASQIDIAYYTSTIDKEGYLGSPHMPLLDNYFDMGVWEKRNITIFEIIENVDFDHISLQEFSEFKFSIQPDYYINVADLEEGQLVLFKAGEETGIIRINNFQQINDYNTWIKFDMKVFK